MELIVYPGPDGTISAAFKLLEFGGVYISCGFATYRDPTVANDVGPPDIVVEFETKENSTCHGCPNLAHNVEKLAAKASRADTSTTLHPFRRKELCARRLDNTLDHRQMSLHLVRHIPRITGVAEK